MRCSDGWCDKEIKDLDKAIIIKPIMVVFCNMDCAKAYFNRLSSDGDYVLEKMLKIKDHDLTDKPGAFIDPRELIRVRERTDLNEKDAIEILKRFKPAKLGLLCHKYGMTPMFAIYALFHLRNTGDVEFTVSMMKEFLTELRLFGIANELFIEAACSVTPSESRKLKEYADPDWTPRGMEDESD